MWAQQCSLSDISTVNSLASHLPQWTSPNRWHYVTSAAFAAVTPFKTHTSVCRTRGSWHALAVPEVKMRKSVQCSPLFGAHLHLFILGCLICNFWSWITSSTVIDLWVPHLQLLVFGFLIFCSWSPHLQLVVGLWVPHLQLLIIGYLFSLHSLLALTELLPLLLLALTPCTNSLHSQILKRIANEKLRLTASKVKSKPTKVQFMLLFAHAWQNIIFYIFIFLCSFLPMRLTEHDKQHELSQLSAMNHHSPKQLTSTGHKVSQVILSFVHLTDSTSPPLSIMQALQSYLLAIIKFDILLHSVLYYTCHIYIIL